MSRGLYTAAAGMLSQLVLQDTVANNIANVNTVGFKRTGVSFEGFSPLLLSRYQQDLKQSVGNLIVGNQVHQTAIDWTPGSVQQTGNPYDVAIQGEGFFVVKTPDGKESYTRNGSFTRSAQGFLVTQTGDQLLGENNTPINIPQSSSQLQIDKAGTILVDGQRIDRLKLVTFDKLNAMQSLGEHHFNTTQAPKPATAATMIQGAVERPNVNIVSEMLHNMTGMRIYETLQKAVQVQSETLKKAVTEVGRVR
jgi:flagellar basal-body rod protein FlgF